MFFVCHQFRFDQSTFAFKSEVADKNVNSELAFLLLGVRCDILERLFLLQLRKGDCPILGCVEPKFEMGDKEYLSFSYKFGIVLFQIIQTILLIALAKKSGEFKVVRHNKYCSVCLFLEN